MRSFALRSPPPSRGSTRPLTPTRGDTGGGGSNNSKAAVKLLKWNVPCVYIAENLQPKWPSCFAPPRALSAAARLPPTIACAVDDAPGATGRLGCANGAGSAVFVTGGVGFFAASYIVAQLAQAPSAEVAARA